jgi:aldehyde:ferredoxin oxidoreductase
MIYVVGCNHGIQPRDEDWLARDSPEANAQKAHFAELIERTIQQGEIQFVGEEWGLSDTTTARASAGTHEIPWVNINTSRDDLDRLGIPHDYVKGNFSEAQKRHWHSQREQVMLCKLKENWGEALNVLAVCGFEHMEPLAELLRIDGVAAETVDYRKMDWYRAGVFSGDA